MGGWSRGSGEEMNGKEASEWLEMNGKEMAESPIKEFQEASSILEFAQFAQHDGLETRLHQARKAHEALFGRSRGAQAKLPPPPAWVSNGFVDVDAATSVGEVASALLKPMTESPQAHSQFHPPRAFGSPREEPNVAPRNFSWNHTPLGALPYSPMRYQPMPVHSMPGQQMVHRRAESLPPIPSAPGQFLFHTMMPVTVFTPSQSLSPTRMDARPDFDASRAAVVSCRMLAEAGRDAAARSAAEAVRQAEARIYEEVRRSQGFDHGSANEAAEHLRREVGGLRERQREFEALKAERDSEVEDLRRRVSTLEVERERLIGEVSHFMNTGHEREEIIATMTVSLEEERSSSRRLNEELRQVQALRDQLMIVETERDNLTNDMVFLKSASVQKDQSISSLRQALDEERRNFKAEVSSLKDELRRSTSTTRRESASQDEQMRIAIQVREERDRLQQDIVILKNAGREREQTIARLRQSVEDQREATREMGAEVRLTKARLSVEQADTEYDTNTGIERPIGERRSLQRSTLLLDQRTSMLQEATMQVDLTDDADDVVMQREPATFDRRLSGY